MKASKWLRIAIVCVLIEKSTRIIYTIALCILAGKVDSPALYEINILGLTILTNIYCIRSLTRLISQEDNKQDNQQP